MTEIWELSNIDGTCKLLLLALADHANEEYRECWPSIYHLAHKTGISIRHTKRLLALLFRAGFIMIHRGEGRGHTNLYRIADREVLPTLPGVYTNPLPIEESKPIDTGQDDNDDVDVTISEEELKGDMVSPPKGDMVSPEMVTWRHPEPSINHQTPEPSSLPARDPFLLSANVLPVPEGSPKVAGAAFGSAIPNPRQTVGTPGGSKPPEKKETTEGIVKDIPPTAAPRKHEGRKKKKKDDEPAKAQRFSMMEQAVIEVCAIDTRTLTRRLYFQLRAAAKVLMEAEHTPHEIYELFGDGSAWYRIWPGKTGAKPRIDQVRNSIGALRQLADHRGNGHTSGMDDALREFYRRDDSG